MSQTMRASLVVTGDASGMVGELNRTSAHLEKAGVDVEKLGNKLQRIKPASDRATRSLIESATGAGRAMASARSSAEAFSQSIEKQERSFNALRASVDPLYRVERQFAAAQDEVNRSLRGGVVSADEAARVMQRLESQYSRARIEAIALDAAQLRVGRGSRQMTGQIQNTAFQIGDFAVQVGAGTRASVALGQQLPQLLGAFGMWGAVAGAAVAIGVPLVSSFFKSADAADTLEESLQRVEITAQAYNDALERAARPASELKAIYRDLGDEVERISRLDLGIMAARADAAIGQTQKKLVDDLGGIDSTKKVVPDVTMTQRLTLMSSPLMAQQMLITEHDRAVQRLVKQYELVVPAADAYVTALEALGSAKGPEEQAAALTAMKEALVEGVGSVEKVAEAFGGDDGLWSTLSTAYESAMDRVKDMQSESYAEMLSEARAREMEMADLTEMRAYAVQRLRDAQAQSDIEAAAAARDVINETDRQIRQTIDAEGRVGDLVDQFEELKAQAAAVDFDGSGRLREAAETLGTRLAIAQTELDDLSNADVSTLEAALKALVDVLDDVARGARGAMDGLNAPGLSPMSGPRLPSQMFGTRSDTLEASREMIIRFEGKADQASWDENAQRAGYGSSTVTLADGSVREITAGMKINWADAERDLDRRISGYHDELRKLVGGAVFDGFSPQEIAAIASIQHNYGSIPDRVKPALQTGDAQLIAQAIARLAMDRTKSERAAGKEGLPMNYSRRMAEAAQFGDVSAIDKRFSGQADAARERQRLMEADQRKRDQEAKRQAQLDERARASISNSLGRDNPTLDRDLDAAKAWRDAQLKALDETKAGYEEFAADVETIYQTQVAKAYEQDLARQSDWQAGIVQGFKEIENRAVDFSDLSRDLFVNWSEGIGEAFGSLVKTGKADLDELLDYTADQILKMSYQMMIQPMVNQMLQTGLTALGGAIGVPLTLPTAHTGGTGIMRSYSSGNRPRSDERLAMLRDGEEVFTPRMLENANAIVRMMAQDGGGGGTAVIDARPVISVVNNSRGDVSGEIEETTDNQGQRQYRLVIDDMVGAAVGVSGGRTQKSMRAKFGIRPTGVSR